MKKEQVIYTIIIVVSIIGIVVPLIKELHRESLPLEIGTNEMPLAKLAFSRKIIDLGEVPEDTILVAKYMLYNTSENLLVIEYVNPDCSCTDYKLSNYSIHPRDSALLTLFLNTANKIGSYELNTILKANTIEKMYMVQMKAKIKENIK